VQARNEITGEECMQAIPRRGDVFVPDAGLAQLADVIGQPVGEPGVIRYRLLDREDDGHAVPIIRSGCEVWRCVADAERASVGNLASGGGGACCGVGGHEWPALGSYDRHLSVGALCSSLVGPKVQHSRCGRQGCATSVADSRQGKARLPPDMSS
jgi:hypothetical protein